MTVQCKVCGDPFLCLSEMPRDTCNACLYRLRWAKKLALGSNSKTRNTRSLPDDPGSDK